LHRIYGNCNEKNRKNSGKVVLATGKTKRKQKLTTWQAALKLTGTGKILDMTAVLK